MAAPAVILKYREPRRRSRQFCKKPATKKLLKFVCGGPRGSSHSLSSIAWVYAESESDTNFALLSQFHA
ncbi:unnamed protein product [Sphenostylis stenocarpa]|uniref:Ribosomal protein L32 n=1 Tax=Sphenostylis stenocarpa TaxID=92480 RepID=A0AA86RME9_9FABA|nr:unnamed protein product [Sphenostylis stenocarpa]